MTTGAESDLQQLKYLWQTLLVFGHDAARRPTSTRW
jgi:hypothetical protein